jgi:hypothetical protein
MGHRAWGIGHGDSLSPVPPSPFPFLFPPLGGAGGVASAVGLIIKISTPIIPES